MSINQAFLHGNLGQDPEIRYMQDGKAACNFSLATTNKWKDQNGQPQELTQWHRVVAFGKLAEVIGQYLKKGDSCIVAGEIRYREWQDNEGNNRKTTEILANKIDFTKTSGQGQQQQPPQQQPQRTQQQANRQGGHPGNQQQMQQPHTQQGRYDDFDDDIGF